MITPHGLADLVSRARAKEPNAQRELLDRIGQDLEGIVLAQGCISTAAEGVSDLAQEAAMRIWAKIEQFEGTEDDDQTAAMLHAWVRQVVGRLASNHHEARHARKRRPDLPVLSLDVMAGGLPIAGEQTPSAVIGEAELAASVREAVGKLPDALDRRILELCFEKSLSLRSIADQLTLSYDHVRQRYHAALRRLEKDLKGRL